VRRGFLRERGDLFRFRHGLIYDATYRGTPKELRAELHERYADVLAARDDDDEVVGYHLERAYLLRAELGPPERHAQRLADEAAARLGAAASRALRRNDVGAGTMFVRRVLALRPAETLPRGLLCEHGVALATAGDAEGAERALSSAAEAARAAGDRGAELRARVEIAARRVLTEPEGAADAFLEITAEALPVFEQLADDRALGRTWMLTAWLDGGMRCQNAASAVAAERALDHYRRAGWPASACLAQLCSALCNGPTPVDEAVVRCKDLLAEVEDLAGEASVRAFLGALEGMRGRFDEAGKLIGEARALFDDLGHTTAVGRTCGPLAAFVHLLADDVAAAETDLREACTILRLTRDRGRLATEAASLADVLYRQRRYDEARRWIRTAEQNTASDDVGAQFAWRSVRAKLHARRGYHARAETLAREAVQLAERTDALNQRAETFLALAEVLQLGDRDGAAAAAASATRLFEQKGASVAAAKSRRLLANAVPT
jgi:tetratricopeptide (TPR) repeat protein